MESTTTQGESIVNFKECTAEELLDWLAHYEEDAAEELKERFNDVIVERDALVKAELLLKRWITWNDFPETKDRNLEVETRKYFKAKGKS